jgi:hypothetical protein
MLEASGKLKPAQSLKHVIAGQHFSVPSREGAMLFCRQHQSFTRLKSCATAREALVIITPRRLSPFPQRF